MDDHQEHEHELEQGTSSLADRFALSQTWSLASRLVRRHPHLIISRVVDSGSVPLLLVHDDSAALRVQFDLPAYIQYAVGEDMRRLTWAQVFAQADPNTVVRQIEEDLGLTGPPRPGVRDPKVLAYRTIACALALGLDHPGAWQAIPAKIDPMDPAASDWDLFAALPGGVQLAEAHIGRVVDRAREHGAAPFTYHQPVWAMLCDVRPVALLDVDGAVYTQETVTDLLSVFADRGSVVGIVGELFGSSLG